MPNHDLTSLALTPRIEERDGQLFVMTEAEGIDLDRRDMVGYGVATPRNARRLVAAIEAGAVFHDFTVRTDINGRTYLSASSRVSGRYMNSDLKRLGF